MKCQPVFQLRLFSTFQIIGCHHLDPVCRTGAIGIVVPSCNKINGSAKAQARDIPIVTSLLEVALHGIMANTKNDK